MTEVIPPFDDIDIFVLANRFSIAELRQELRLAELRAFLSNYFSRTPYQTPEDSFPWADFAAACGQAILWLKHKPTTATQTPGKRVDVAAIKARADIVSIIERYTQLRKSGDSYTGRCPLHQDKSPSLIIYPERQSWHCFGACNTGGDVIAFIQAVENTDFKGAVAILEGAS